MHYTATTRISAARQCERLARAAALEMARGDHAHALSYMTGREYEECGGEHRTREELHGFRGRRYANLGAAVGVPARWQGRFNAVVAREYDAALLRLAPWAFDGPEE
jgi:hypothetical protein